MQHDRRNVPNADLSPDGEDRIRDFLGRHGGAGPARRGGNDDSGMQGWYEIPAADGYMLRCDWAHVGDHEELRYAEVAPHS